MQKLTRVRGHFRPSAKTAIEPVNPDSGRRGKAGRIFFLLYARFGAGAPPTRRTIGIYGAMKLEEARRIAGEWRSLIAKGIDPAVIEAERRATEARERALRIKHSLTSVAEAFITDKLAKERSGKIAERDLRNTFIAAWAERPVSEVTALDLLEIINSKKRTAPKMAGALLVLIRRFFAWAIDQQVYGLTASPCDRLSVVKIVGPTQSRDRRLSDIELAAFWRATGRMGYPTGSVYRTLLLTGLRLNEAAQISWPEIQGDTLTIPAADLDGRMLRTLKALARRRGEDHQAVDLPGWVNHDLRRVVRSGLSALRVPHNVAEAVLAHRPPGIVGTYNLHEYEDEKAEALELWAQRLNSIVSPPAKVPDKKIVPLRKRRR